MRVLQLDTGREMRGGQWQALYLVRSFRSTLMAPEGSPLYSAARAEGIEALPFGPVALARAAARHDLVHAHDARAHSFAAAFGSRPLVVSRRVAFPVHGGWLSRRKYARASHYLAVSEFVRGRLLEAGVASERITVVPDGVVLPDRLSDRTGPVAAPAFDDPRKGTDVAMRAASLAGIEIRFSRDLTGDLTSASLFVYLTREEGLGSAALLAMAAGVPVIASRVGGLPEAVGDAGLLVDNEPAEVADAIRRVLGDPALAGRLAAEGRRRVAQKFTVAAMVDGAVAVYRKVLGE